MGSHNDDLILEMRDARKKERAALAAVNEAKVAYRERVAEWKAAGKLVDEILAEIETGSSGRPILDLAMPRNGNGDGHANGNGKSIATDFDRDIAKAVEKAEALKALRGKDAYAAAMGEFDEATQVIRWTTESLRGAIERAEGVGGDGSRSKICMGCGAIRPIRDDKPCRRCRSAVSRTALGVLEDLAAGREPGIRVHLGPNVGDWRAVTVEELMAAIGPAGGIIASNLRREYEIETVDDLAESLRDSLFAWAEIPDAEARAIRDALRIFREGRGWDDRTQYPDGLPAAWIAEEDDDQAEAVESKPDGGKAAPRDFSAAQAVFIPKPAGGWNGERLYSAAEQAFGPNPHVEKLARLVICEKCSGLSRPHGKPARCVGMSCGSTEVVSYPEFAKSLGDKVVAEILHPDKSKPVEHICDLHGGRPWTDADIDALLVHACRKYSRDLGKWFADHDTASDEELYVELRKHWPHSRVFTGPDRSGSRHGYTLAQHGPELRFWVGVFKGAGHMPTLAGQALLDRVRTMMGLLRPTAGEPEPGAGFVRTCNRCNVVRPNSKGVCPACKCPEFRIEDRAGRADWTPPTGAGPIDTGEWSLARFRKAIEATEGVGGDGSRTVMCAGCRAALPVSATKCPHCRSTETVPSAVVLRQLEAAPAKAKKKGRKAEVAS